MATKADMCGSLAATRVCFESGARISGCTPFDTANIAQPLGTLGALDDAAFKAPCTQESIAVEDSGPQDVMNIEQAFAKLDI
mmetsp:Transcript_40848/g.126306  ORF Transcript_40848/g.126306 Transcript_40848/m.126306 type:complete len:82 (-) Transcript_40848:41-286(-)